MAAPPAWLESPELRDGTVRRWIVNKLTNAKNLDGSQALDDNTLKNYSGKMVGSLNQNQKLLFSYLWNDKIRGHRRDYQLYQYMQSQCADGCRFSCKKSIRKRLESETVGKNFFSPWFTSGN